MITIKQKEGGWVKVIVSRGSWVQGQVSEAVLGACSQGSVVLAASPAAVCTRGRSAYSPLSSFIRFFG